MTTTTFRRLFRGPSVRLISAGVAALIFGGHGSVRPDVQAQANPIVNENLKPGATDWDVSGSGDPDVQGFATDISVNVGQTVHFKIATPGAATYQIKIYRLG